MLSDLKIIEREIPVTEEKPAQSKKGLYRITDEFFRFWFRFVFPRRGELEMGKTGEVLAEINAGLPQHLSAVYEKVAAELLGKHRDRFFPFTSIGRWWEKNEEIDIVAVNSRINSILFTEVKWSEKPVGIDIYESLKQKAQKVIWGKKARKEHFCLFGKSGFTEAMRKKAEQDAVWLFQGETIIR